MFYDAHNHLQDTSLAPHHEKIFADLVSIGVTRAVVNGSCETDWPEVTALAKQHTIVLPSYGLHPWEVGNRTPDWQKNLLTHLDPHSSPPSHSSHSPAVGEIGLDRWILNRARSDDPRLAGLRRAPLAEQTEVFAWQLAIAAERNLPASIHCLDAFGLLLDTLRHAKIPARGFLLHAYSGPTEMVKSFADLGAYFSFNGAYLAPRHTRLRELYTALPADRLLVETDAPAMRLPAPLEKFLLPASDDGSLPNHPANLAVTYAALAELRGVTLESLAAHVEKNFLRLFAP